jgi:hypothetical protein
MCSPHAKLKGKENDFDRRFSQTGTAPSPSVSSISLSAAFLEELRRLGCPARVMILTICRRFTPSNRLPALARPVFGDDLAWLQKYLLSGRDFDVIVEQDLVLRFPFTVIVVEALDPEDQFANPPGRRRLGPFGDEPGVQRC